MALRRGDDFAEKKENASMADERSQMNNVDSENCVDFMPDLLQMSEDELFDELSLLQRRR